MARSDHRGKRWASGIDVAETDMEGLVDVIAGVQKHWKVMAIAGRDSAT